MDNGKEAWQYLIDVAFNGKRNVPIELISEFRKLATLHKVDYYCDFLRGKKLPDNLLLDPWEWKYLEDLSRILPETVQIVVLKGAAVRDMDLYPFSNFRKSDDLDIFVYGLESYKEKKDFIELLIKERKIEPLEYWQSRLKKLGNVIAKHKENFFDIHFELFLPLGNISNFGFGTKKRFKVLEKKIIEKTVPYRGLSNVKKMNYEDHCLYSIFSFLKDFPYSKLTQLLDFHLILKKEKTNHQEILERAKETNQLFLYDVGICLLNQAICNISKETKNLKKLSIIDRLIFKIERIKNQDTFSYKNRLIDSLSKGAIVAKGRKPLSLILSFYYLVANNFIVSDITDESFFSINSLKNFFTKFLYTWNKIKNKLKSLCLKLPPKLTTCDFQGLNIISTTKKLMTLKLEDMKLTFIVPEEFYKDLEKIWKGFLANDHLDKRIEVERVNNNEQEIYNSEVVYSSGNVYLKLSPYSYGIANVHSSGTIQARTFWDVRTFALSLFRAMTFEREDLLLVHAGGVKIKSETLIFPGGTSAGKTTLFNLLLRNGASGTNDDTVLLKHEDAGWFVYPTPFMSNYKEPLICEKSKLSGIIDPIKVCGGHEIRTIDKNYGNAILLNNSLSGFLIDDSGFLLSKIANKVINLSKQVLFYSQIKYSLNDEVTLVELINKWLGNPNEVYSTSSHLIRLIELQGKSMEPTFKEGDILCVEEIFPEKLKPKDVICFSKDPNDFPVVHRVKYLIRHKDSTTIVTKGDGSIYEDPPSAFKANQKILKVTNKFKLGNNI